MEHLVRQRCRVLLNFLQQNTMLLICSVVNKNYTNTVCCWLPEMSLHQRRKDWFLIFSYLQIGTQPGAGYCLFCQSSPILIRLGSPTFSGAHFWDFMWIGQSRHWPKRLIVFWLAKSERESKHHQAPAALESAAHSSLTILTMRHPYYTLWCSFIFVCPSSFMVWQIQKDNDACKRCYLCNSNRHSKLCFPCNTIVYLQFKELMEKEVMWFIAQWSDWFKQR